jgi:hypothetical protein
MVIVRMILKVVRLIPEVVRMFFKVIRLIPIRLKSAHKTQIIPIYQGNIRPLSIKLLKNTP